MDIVTHGMMGAIAAAPLLERHPFIACGVLLGSVLPDIDILAYTFGRRAMMRFHQTWTHSMLGVLLAGLGYGVLLWSVGLPEMFRHEVWLAPLALMIAMSVHIATDWSNTYGVMALAPLKRERMCAEWVFFIDGFVIAINTVTLALIAWVGLDASGSLLWTISGTNWAVLSLYWMCRAWMRHRAGSDAPEGTISLVPSALWPHRYHGCRIIGEVAELFEWDGLRREMRGEPEHIALCDAEAIPGLVDVPEFALMRRLTRAYFPVEADGDRIVCKDLRTRNFATTFGQLDLRVNEAEQGVIVERWHV